MDTGNDKGVMMPRQAAVLAATLRIQSNDFQSERSTKPHGRYASERELRRAEFWRSLTTRH